MIQKSICRENKKPRLASHTLNQEGKSKVTKFTADRFVFSKFDSIYEDLSK
jgi:hypothetical protein